MTKTRRLLALAVVFMMVLALAACSSPSASPSATAAPTQAAKDDGAATTDKGTEEEPDSVEREFYSIEMFNTYANYMGVNGGWWGKILKDELNMELNIISPNVAGTGDTLYQTRSAAGNLGDSIVISSSRMIDCQAAGLLMDMAPYLLDAPNLQKLSIAYEKFAEMFPDGGVYAIPGRVSGLSPTTAAGRGLNPEVAVYLRYDYYMEMGSPEINGWDGLLELLAEMCEKYPTNELGNKTYGYSAFPDWDGNSVRAAHEMLYMDGYAPGNGYIWYNYTNGATTSVVDPEGEYYQHLKRLNKAYNMGILDPDSSTQNWDNIAQKFRDGQVLFGWWPFLASSVFDRFDRTTRYPYAPVPVKGTTLNSPGYNPYGLEGNAYAIGSQAKYPERIIEFYDWLTSPRGIGLTNGRVEGVTYTMVDGQPVLTDFAKDGNIDKQAPEDMGGGTWDDGSPKFNYPLTHQDDPNELLNGASNNSNLWASTIADNNNEWNTHYRDFYKTESPMRLFQDGGMMVVTPGTYYTTPSEPSDITTIRAQIKEIVQPAGWRMIYASNEAEFDSIWQEALGQLDDFGLQELLEYDMRITNEKIAAVKDTLGQ